ncbi:hypothetical protein ABZP36_012057 [Zizania latifolia]
MVIHLLDLNATPPDDGDDEVVLGVGEDIADEEGAINIAPDEGVEQPQRRLRKWLDDDQRYAQFNQASKPASQQPSPPKNPAKPPQRQHSDQQQSPPPAPRRRQADPGD